MSESGRLRKHRENLSREVPPEEFSRIVLTFLQNVRRDDRNTLEFRHVGHPDNRERIKKIVEMIFETQDKLPFFWIDSALPFCWNHPKDWARTHIRYEWGHLEPKDSPSTTVPILENLCLMSARCNNHIQSSLPLEDLQDLFKGSKTGQRIHDVLRRRQELFSSKSWTDVISELRQYRLRSKK
jgi:hypothetical protein